MSVIRVKRSLTLSNTNYLYHLIQKERWVLQFAKHETKTFLVVAKKFFPPIQEDEKVPSYTGV